MKRLLNLIYPLIALATLTAVGNLTAESENLVIISGVVGERYVSKEAENFNAVDASRIGFDLRYLRFDPQLYLSFGVKRLNQKNSYVPKTETGLLAKTDTEQTVLNVEAGYKVFEKFLPFVGYVRADEDNVVPSVELQLRQPRDTNEDGIIDEFDDPPVEFFAGFNYSSSSESEQTVSAGLWYLIDDETRMGLKVDSNNTQFRVLRTGDNQALDFSIGKFGDGIQISVGIGRKILN